MKSSLKARPAYLAAVVDSGSDKVILSFCSSSSHQIFASACAAAGVACACDDDDAA
jgi:hypothetical protein